MESQVQPNEEVLAEEERREDAGQTAGELLMPGALSWEDYMGDMPCGD